MNIKSLLLGSAAALTAVSGASAADAIIAEPEPVEYVRVCDAYGAGFFYIPGTETCLQISGYVRYQFGTSTDNDVNDTPNYNAFVADTWNKQARGRLNIDARSETEWGTLRGYIRIHAERSGNSFNNTNTDQAYLELGGFRAGWTESAWVESQRSGLASYGSHSDGGLYYAYQLRNQVNYSFGSSEGFAATISLEDDDMEPAADPNYMPDVVGVVSYNQPWGAVWAKAAYDEDTSTFTPTGDGEWAAQAGVHFNIPNMEGSSFRLLGFYASDPNIYSVGSEWSILASYFHQFTPTFGASVGAQYLADIDLDGNGLYDGGADMWAAEVSLIWTPVENFEVRTEVNYDKAETLDGTWSGWLRFTRFF